MKKPSLILLISIYFPETTSSFIPTKKVLSFKHETLFECRPVLTNRFRPKVDDWRANFGLHVIAINRIGLTTTDCNNENDTEFESSYRAVKALTQESIQHRGTDQGLQALEDLGRMCNQRIPLEIPEAVAAAADKGAVISHIPGLFSQEEADGIVQIVSNLQDQNMLSANPDSVDGKPSLHLNLVTKGHKVTIDDDTDSKDFQSAIEELAHQIMPKIYNELLEDVRKRLKSDNIQVGDIFLRRYNSDVADGDNNMTCGRSGISAHFDVHSKVTSVIALDDIAKYGQNGLYIVAGGISSNHAALRRFFPLQCGDAAIHTWDVLHGVDVQPLDKTCEVSLERTSLIVWFVEGDTCSGEESLISPWLHARNDLDKNDIAQFVLGSALESSSNAQTFAYYRNLYFRSATKGNSFALTRLGSIFDSSDTSLEDEEYETKCEALLDSLSPRDELPNALLYAIDSLENRSQEKAVRFWYEGAIRGNPLAHFALADILMSFVTLSETESTDTKLLATVLFALAAQQRLDHAVDALDRIIRHEMSSGIITSNEEFMQSLIVRTAQVACKYL